MGLSNDLISQFVKVTKDEEKKKSESIVYGTIVDHENVQIDGSDEYTPIITTANVKAKERVTVMIKNHTATVIGNMSDPSASSNDFETSNNKMTNMIDSKASIENLNATNAEITSVKTEYLKSEDAAIKYANIDFSNISNSTMESFYTNSGLIKDAVIGDGTITGSLAGVTIRGDLIESNTIVADKLLLKGEDGLYYKLNTDGVKTESEQTEYNSLNGDIFMANSIAATKISVSDLVAFDATIGGFNITDNSIYSGVKQSVVNATRGIYMDKNGQIAFGDASKYIRFFKDTDNRYKLLISGAVTTNENFKILEDGSMEAINGSFTGTINADNGAIGGITISTNGISAESVVDATNNVIQGFDITKSGGISSYNTGGGIDYRLDISSGALKLSSEGTGSDSNPTSLDLTSSGIYIKYDSDYMVKIYTNGSTMRFNAPHGLTIDTQGVYSAAKTFTFSTGGHFKMPSEGTIIFGNDMASKISSRTGGGFDFYLDSTYTNDIVRIVFDSNGKIYRVDKAGTWTIIAGDASKILEDIENGTY